MLGNLTMGENLYFSSDKDMVTHFDVVDNYILSELERVKNSVIKHYSAFDYAKGVSEMVNFISFDLSSFYLDITKDILYCENKDSLRRKQVQSVIYICLDTLMRMLAPILSFTMEEVYDCLHIDNKKKSVHLLDFPKESHLYNQDIAQDYVSFKHIRDLALLSLEEARKNNVIGSSQEALLDLNISNEHMFNVLSKLSNNELSRLFIVSKVDLHLDEMDVAHAIKSKGMKCPRCWNYVDELCEIDGQEVCPRCKEALKHE
jgi:isoleucyl-tRNA synthetase